MYATLWSVAIASETPLPVETSRHVLQARLVERGIRELKCYSPASHFTMLTGFPFLDALLAAARTDSQTTGDV
jgi:hypothetical protein